MVAATGSAARRVRGSPCEGSYLLASEGRTHFDNDHPWHLTTLSRLATAQSDPVFLATAAREVDLSDDGSVAEAAAWWEEQTNRGGEGMVAAVKKQSAALVNDALWAEVEPLLPAAKPRRQRYAGRRRWNPAAPGRASSLPVAAASAGTARSRNSVLAAARPATSD